MQQWRRYIPLLTVFCLAAFSAAGQQDTPATPDTGQSAQPKSSTTKPKQKRSLADATRVSTAEAARKAAKDSANGHGIDTASEASATPDVLEFHPADPGPQASVGAAISPSKESRKSALKNVHGDAHGALDSRGAGRRAGGSVGATSKSGKSSIYVETDRSRETTPAPH